MKPDVTAFYDETTATVSYVVADTATGKAAIIDSVWDYDPHAGRFTTGNADRIVDFVEKHDLSVDWILETHAHADHITAAQVLKSRLGGRIGTGDHIVEIQKTWKEIYDLPPEFPIDGRQFDHLFTDDETFPIGDLTGRVLYTPGHTPDSVTYLIGDAAFVGDTLFMPDYGTARCDFPGGDAATLYRTIQRLYALPPETRLFMCHDYRPDGRALEYETSVAEQRAANIHLNGGTSEADFVRLRTERDKDLATPVLLLPAIQVNIRAGNLPPPAGNGRIYLKIPTGVL